MKLAAFGLNLLFLVMGCSHSRVIEIKNNKVLADKTLMITTEWMTVRKTKFETSINLKNEAKGPILVLQKDVGCEAGMQKGDLSTPDYQNPNGVLAFRKDESKNLFIRCRFANAPQPPYRITVATVFANPKGDGLTPGAILAKNVLVQQTGL